MALNTHEHEFARNFIVPEKRARYLSLLESKNGRKKILNGLNHCRDLDPRFATRIPDNQSSIESIELILRQKGAPDMCYLMSDNPDIDGQEMPLPEALSKTVGLDAGTLVSCIPGKLAYFEMEAFDGRYMLERKFIHTTGRIQHSQRHFQDAIHERPVNIAGGGDVCRCPINAGSRAGWMRTH